MVQAIGRLGIRQDAVAMLTGDECHDQARSIHDEGEMPENVPAYDAHVQFNKVSETVKHAVEMNWYSIVAVDP